MLHHPKQKLRRRGGHRQINTCRNVLLHANFFLLTTLEIAFYQSNFYALNNQTKLSIKRPADGYTIHIYMSPVNSVNAGPICYNKASLTVPNSTSIYVVFKKCFLFIPPHVKTLKNPPPTILCPECFSALSSIKHTRARAQWLLRSIKDDGAVRMECRVMTASRGDRRGGGGELSRGCNSKCGFHPQSDKRGGGGIIGGKQEHKHNHRNPHFYQQFLVMFSFCLSSLQCSNMMFQFTFSVLNC